MLQPAPRKEILADESHTAPEATDHAKDSDLKYALEEGKGGGGGLSEG